MGEWTPINLGVQSNPGRHQADGNARLINVYAENIGGEGKIPMPLYASAGLADFATLTGGGGVRGMLAVENVLYVVAGRQIFRVDENGNSSQIGGIPNDGPVSMARNLRDTPQVAVVADGLYYLIENDAVTQVTDPDLPPAFGVVYSNGVFVLPTARRRVYSTADQQGNSIDPLEFESMDSNSDNNVGIGEREQELAIFGTQSIEWWSYSGSEGFPFDRVTTRGIGCKSAASITKVAGTLAWIADDNTARLMSGYDGDIISHHAVSTAIETAANPSLIKGVSWSERGHTFFGLLADEWTWIYDLRTRLWHERQSYGLNRWRAGAITTFVGRTIVGDYATGKIYTMKPEYASEADQPLRAVIQALVMAYPHRGRHNGIRFDVVPGVGLGSGDAWNTDPHAMIDFSDDGGRTFESERQEPIGRQGSSSARAQRLRLGRHSEDGRYYRITVSADVVKAFTGAAINADVLKV